MPLGEAPDWRRAGLGLGLLVLVGLVWRTLVFPAEPASTPIRLVDSPVLAPAAPDQLPRGVRGAAAGPRVRLIFAGDLMQHRNQSHDSFQASYAGIAPFLRNAEIAVANLEFPADSARPVGPEPGSTTFNGSPAHLDAIAAAGFDVLQTANNHALDQGVGGAAATWAAVRARGMDAVGTAPSRTALLAQRVVVRTVGGLRIGFVAYSFWPNRYPEAGRLAWPPRDAPIMALNFQDWSDEYRAEGRARFQADIDSARAQHVDFLVALVHWGDEWHLQPSEDQKLAGHDLIDAGFDLVVGGHSHVLNPAEVYRGHLIAYSLGTLIADFRPLEPRTGALLEADVARAPDGGARLADFRWHPTLVDRAQHRIRLVGPASQGEEFRAWSFARARLGAGVAAP